MHSRLSVLVQFEDDNTTEHGCAPSNWTSTRLSGLRSSWIIRPRHGRTTTRTMDGNQFKIPNAQGPRD